jgi:hypothetical protein
MTIKESRLKLYFEEIKKSGQISSWYLSEKYGVSRNVVKDDLMYARKNDLVKYKNLHVQHLLLNFELTTKGFNYDFEESTKISAPVRENKLKTLKVKEILNIILQEIRKRKTKGLRSSELSDTFGCSKASARKYLRILIFSNLVIYDCKRQVYVSFGYGSMIENIRALKKAFINTFMKGAAATW